MMTFCRHDYIAVYTNAIIVLPPWHFTSNIQHGTQIVYRCSKCDKLIANETDDVVTLEDIHGGTPLRDQRLKRLLREESLTVARLEKGGA